MFEHERLFFRGVRTPEEMEGDKAYLEALMRKPHGKESLFRECLECDSPSYASLHPILPMFLLQPPATVNPVWKNSLNYVQRVNFAGEMPEWVLGNNFIWLASELPQGGAELKQLEMGRDMPYGLEDSLRRAIRTGSENNDFLSPLCVGIDTRLMWAQLLRRTSDRYVVSIPWGILEYLKHLSGVTNVVLSSWSDGGPDKPGYQVQKTVSVRTAGNRLLGFVFPYYYLPEEHQRITEAYYKEVDRAAPEVNVIKQQQQEMEALLFA